MMGGGRAFAGVVYRGLRCGLALWWPVALLLLLATVPARVAMADDPEMSATVDTQRLGLGDVLRLSLHVASSHFQPSSPQPGTTHGFSIVGSSSGPSQQVSIINGRMTTQHGLDVNWSLRADKVGTWSIGPVSVKVGGSSYRTGTIRIVVVPAGQGAPHPAPDPMDPFGGGGGPFDPFRSLFDQLNGQNRPADTYGGDPKLALDAPLGAIAFLHATVDTTNVVVGQQVTVSMYFYSDVTARDPGTIDVHEATAPDFVKRSLYEDDNGDRAGSKAMVGGHLYNVRLIRKSALFPLKAGDLTVSPMELTLQRSRSTGDPSRKSEELTIHVTDPPTDHRPPGYQLGDVGKFSLTADVTPRDIEQDGAVGVTLTLEGTGNLPAMITPPAQAGFEWLIPEVHEKLGAMKDDRYGGSRTFSYVLRVHKSGDVRLGSIRLPYWDPAANRYDVARADLGPLTVHPSTTPKTAADAPPDPFSTLPDVRSTMGATKAPDTHLAEARPGLFWLALTVTPLGFAIFSGASSTIKTVRARVAAKAASPETDLKAKLAASEQAFRANDARTLAAATARALEAATLVYAEVNVRDLRGAEIATRLTTEAEVDVKVAADIVDILAECEAARFSPDAPDLADARARWTKAKGVIETLRKEA
jgi:hypothetical protein